MSSKPIRTEYANTDFDLKSRAAFDALHAELLKTGCVLQYAKGDDDRWHAVVEANHGEDLLVRDAAMDISSILDVLNDLRAPARAELLACELREFNIGFHCGDTWAFVHQLPDSVIRSVADASCSLAVTLYPMRNIDGTPKL